MKLTISIIALTLVAAVAQANGKVVALVGGASDAKNIRIVNFTKGKVDIGEREKIKNPNYGNCSSIEVPGTDCEKKEIEVAKQVDGYVVEVQFDSADFPRNIDDNGFSSKATQYFSFPAPAVEGFALPAKKVARLALAEKLFAPVAVTSEVVHTLGAYACNSGSDGTPDESGPVCYSPHDQINYYLTLSTKN